MATRAEQITAHEPPLPVSSSGAPVHRTLDSLPAAVGGTMISMESSTMGDSEEERRFAIIEASRSRDCSKLPNLISLLETDTYSNRRHISRALGHIGGEAAVQVLLQLLDQEEGLILGDVARSLGRLQVVAATPRLQSMRGNPLAWVSESARWACEELRRAAEQSAPPTGGPATPPGISGVAVRPPSVS